MIRVDSLMALPSQITKRCSACMTPHHSKWTKCQLAKCGSPKMNRRTPLNGFPVMYVDENGTLVQRPKATAAKKAAPPVPTTVTCKCGVINAAYRSYCRGCGVPLTPPKVPARTTGMKRPPPPPQSPPTTSVEDRITALDEKLDKILTIVEEMKIAMWAERLHLDRD